MKLAPAGAVLLGMKFDHSKLALLHEQGEYFISGMVDSDESPGLGITVWECSGMYAAELDGLAFGITALDASPRLAAEAIFEQVKTMLADPLGLLTKLWQVLDTASSDLGRQHKYNESAEASGQAHGFRLAKAFMLGARTLADQQRPELRVELGYPSQPA